MVSADHAKYRVAILSSDPQARTDLIKILENHNLQVVLNAALDPEIITGFDHNSSDIILLDLDEELDHELDLVETLLEQALTPVLFNDTATTRFLSSGVANRGWGKTLAQKLTQMIGAAAPVESHSLVEQATDAHPAQPHPTPTPGPGTAVLPAIWVLGASLGGPIACREFFRHLSADLPVSFLLAQHIGASHVDLLAQQLNRNSEIQVIPAVAGTGLRKGLALVAPVDQRLKFDPSKQIVFGPRDPQCVYTPCIDHVIGDTIAAFGDRVNVIIFSGMGFDGEQGCRLAGEHGCQVWAQDSESCVISSMPDHARLTGAVSFSGSPQQLAQRLTELYQA
ncbi:MAG: chemotaxis protein CheB [Nitrospira sp.]|nr:chemotaxis protein CheB [Nitrospira sp.]